MALSSANANKSTIFVRFNDAFHSDFQMKMFACVRVTWKRFFVLSLVQCHLRAHRKPCCDIGIIVAVNVWNRTIERFSVLSRSPLHSVCLLCIIKRTTHGVTRASCRA